MSLPSATEVRKRIRNVPQEDMRLCLMTCYAYAGRISEVVGCSSPSDNTTARGPRGHDVHLDSFKLGRTKEPAAVFTVRTAKRDGMIRKIGLPLNFDGWATPLLEYFKDAKDSLVFPFTRQHVGTYVREHGVFKGLTYPIETYGIYKEGKLVKKVEKHTRQFGLHALRHQRATELVEHYGFDGFNLAAYGGWTIRTSQLMFGVLVPVVFSRYLYLNWQGYFPKLLKESG